MEVIIALVAAGIFLIAMIIIAIMCKLRSREVHKTQQYKEREKINAARKFERTTLERKLQKESAGRKR